MKAIQLIKHGPAQSAFKLVELAEPTLKSNDVLIEVEASGINFADILARQGLYKAAPKPPSIIGYDVVGKVVEVGSEVDTNWIGKRVTALTRFGAYASKVATSVNGIAEVGNMEVTLAASMATQGSTAWYAINYLVNIMPGERVLIYAAAGGVGNLLVQMAKQKGAEVVALVGSTQKENEVKNLKADYVINYKTTNHHTWLFDKFGKKAIDVSFNAVGGSTLKNDFKLLKAGGRIVTFGAAEVSGKKPGIFTLLGLLWRTGWYSPLFLLGKGKSIIGLNLLPLSKDNPKMVSHCMQQMVALVQQKIVKPLQGKIFGVNQMAEAHEFVQSGKSVGKVVITWN